VTQRVIVAVLYGLSAASAAITATGMPSTPEGWASLAVTFAIAAWGKFSSNTTVIAPNRAAWTPEQRKQEALDELNKGL
jgi:hypothetical protein